MKSEVSDTNWMNGLRALAVIGVVMHHWLFFVPFEGSIQIMGPFAGVVRAVGGTVVHLFFLLSGCGLAISYLKGEPILWGGWIGKRFQKVILPYWIIVVVTFGLANFYYFASGNWGDSYSLQSLFSYLSFTRNHYEPGKSMNPSLWFMPVIIGLYALFPILMRFLKRYGISRLLILSGIITCSSITVFEFSGYKITHQSAIFLFFLLDFVMGMVIGSVWFTDAECFSRLLGRKSFFLGLVFYASSYATTQLWEYGDLYNDALTCAGVFLMAISCWFFLCSKMGHKLDSIVREVSRISYMMYLIHVPLILYVVKPLLSRTIGFPLNPLLSLGLSGVFAFVVFVIARVLYGPVMAVASMGWKETRS